MFGRVCIYTEPLLDDSYTHTRFISASLRIFGWSIYDVTYKLKFRIPVCSPCESRIPIPQKHEIPLTFIIEIPASRPCCQLKSWISPWERAKSLSRQTYCRSLDSHPSSVKGSLPLISLTARLFHYSVKGWQNLFLHRQKNRLIPWLVYRLLRLSGLCCRYEVRLHFCCFTPPFPSWILLTISITVYAVRCFPTVNPFQN